LESRQNPQRRVHALLGSLPAYQNAAEKRNHRQHAQLLHTTYFLAMAKTDLTKTPNSQKRQPTKTPAEKNGLCQSKPQTNQNENFGKPDFD